MNKNTMSIFLLVVLFMLICIQYSLCNEIFQDKQDFQCETLIETSFNQCSIKMRPNYMGRVMIAMQNGNDEKGIEFCRLVPEGAQCVLDKLPADIPDDCKSLENYQSKIIVAQHDKTYAQYFCANNMQHIRDRSELDGMDCLYVSEFYRCMPQNDKSEEIKLTKKEELCRDYNSSIECSKHWGACQNQKVASIQRELFNVMLLGMECSPAL